MGWLLPAQIVALTGSLILVFTYLNLYLEERQKHLAFWLASWALYVARSVFEILVVFYGSQSALVALNLLSLIWSAALLLWGTCLFSGKKLNGRWLALFTAGSLWIVAALSFRLPSLWITVPSYLLSAFASVATGVALLRFREATGPARFTAGWAFILWGLHKADHPLLRPLSWAAPFGYVFGAVLGFVSAIGIVLVYLEKTKKDLHLNRLQLSDAADLARIAHWEYDEVSNVYTFNDAFYALYATTADREGGYRMAREEYLRTFVHPDDLEELHRKIEEARVHPNPAHLEEYEHRAIRRDGEVIHILARKRVVTDVQGRPVMAIGVNQDISERKEAEEALKKSAEHFRVLFNGLSDAVFVHRVSDNLPGRIIEVNDLACRTLGYSRAELLRMTPMEIDAPEGRFVAKPTMDHLKAHGQAMWEGMHQAKDGRKIPMELRSYLFEFEGEPAVLSVARDITERKQAEDALLESETKLRAVLDGSRDAIGISKEGIHVFANPAYLSLFGYDSGDELLSTPIIRSHRSGKPRPRRGKSEETGCRGTCPLILRGDRLEERRDNILGGGQRLHLRFEGGPSFTRRHARHH